MDMFMSACNNYNTHTLVALSGITAVINQIGRGLGRRQWWDHKIAVMPRWHLAGDTPPGRAWRLKWTFVLALPVSYIST